MKCVWYDMNLVKEKQKVGSRNKGGIWKRLHNALSIKQYTNVCFPALSHGHSCPVDANPDWFVTQLLNLQWLVTLSFTYSHHNNTLATLPANAMHTNILYSSLLSDTPTPLHLLHPSLYKCVHLNLLWTGRHQWHQIFHVGGQMGPWDILGWHTKTKSHK